MFMMPMPPTMRDMPAMLPRRMVRVFDISETVETRSC
jgi:hypothetical protein